MKSSNSLKSSNNAPTLLPLDPPRLSPAHLGSTRLGCVVLALALLSISTAFAAEGETQADAHPELLTLDRIYAKSEFTAKGFEGQWDTAGHRYVQLEDSKATPGAKDIVSYDAETHVRSIVVPGVQFIAESEAAPLKIESYSFSKDKSLVLIYTNSKRVWRRKSRGDYWILDRSGRTLRKIASQAPASSTQFAKFSPDSSHVAYVVDGDIFVEDVYTGQARQLTQKPTDKFIHGTFDWVYEEEFGLRDGFRWSPDSQKIAYWRLDTTNVPIFTMVNNTDSLYPKLTQFAHPKTGQKNSECSIHVTNVNSGQSTEYDVPTNHYLARMEWADNSEQLIMQQLNRLQNTNEVKLFDVQASIVSTVLKEQDQAWLDVNDKVHWLAGGAAFTWSSERDGWRHLYVVSRDGKTARLITPGAYDVISLEHIDETRGCAYFIASPDNATERYLYQAQLDGSGAKRVTPTGFVGSHAYQISDDGKFAVHSRSSANDPATVDLILLPEHQLVRTIEDNAKLRDKLNKLDRSEVEFFQIDAKVDGDSVSMDAWCVKPSSLDATKKYPLLIYVYGEPAGSTVVNRWGGNSYLWHAMLAQKGYIVISIDNRGTKVPRGREWRKSIYRKVGLIAPQDQAAALQHLLKKWPYVDADRVGIWGWSGGGSMSLNAIFKYPELYKTAISIAPVPNQRYYDTIYQERYMGLPNDNAEGYREGSPINFASKLEGNLLLVHGTGDDNCHYQTMEMLINELIHHNKPFDMMAYPNRSHSIREGKNTTLHLRSLMTRFIEKNL